MLVLPVAPAACRVRMQGQPVGRGSADQAVDAPERLAAPSTSLISSATPSTSSAMPQASDYFFPAKISIEVQRADLTARVAPILQETVDCSREVLAASNLAGNDLAAILHVRGSTRMPIMADTLVQEFGVPNRHAEDPGTAVVQGARLWWVSW